VVSFATAEEAAWVFEVAPQTIRQWIAEGKLRTAPRLGRKHRIYVESIAEQSGFSVERVSEIIVAGRQSQSNDSTNGTTNKLRPYAPASL
jgi:excisionase family DNA binding protein